MNDPYSRVAASSHAPWYDYLAYIHVYMYIHRYIHIIHPNTSIPMSIIWSTNTRTAAMDGWYIHEPR